MGAKKRGRGRPRLGQGETERLEIRVAPAFRKRCAAAAGREGVTEAEWWRRAAEARLRPTARLTPEMQRALQNIVDIHKALGTPEEALLRQLVANRKKELARRKAVRRAGRGTERP